MRNFEKHVPYIVRIKDSYVNRFIGTTIQNRFCGYLINNSNGNSYFELNGNHMLVILPDDAIECMAPSKLHFDMYKADVLYNL